MRSPLAFVAAAFGFGIGLAWWLKPSPPLVGGFLLIAAIGLWGVRGRLAAANLTLWVLTVALGALRAQGDAQIPFSSVSWALTETPQPITCEGRVVSDVDWFYPPVGPARLQGWLKLARIQQGNRSVPVSGRLLVRFPAVRGPEYGERLRLTGEIRGLTQKERRLWVKGAAGRLVVSDPAGVEKVDASPTPWARYRRWVAQVRGRLRELGRSLLGPVEVAYLEGLLLGEQQRIPRPLMEAFRRTGTIHVLVVSGLHVTLIGAIVFIGLSAVPISRTARYLLAGGSLAGYCTLTGAAPPILRATWMGILFCLARISGREFSALNALGLAGLILLAADPRALADVSFQLSFAAMGGLLILTPWLDRWIKERSGMPRWLGQGLAASCGAWAAVAPVAAWHFQMVTPIALAANLLVVPWASLLIAAGFLFYAAAWWSPLWALAGASGFAALAQGLTWLVTWLAALPGASWSW